MKLTSLISVTCADAWGSSFSSLRAAYRPPNPPPRMRTLHAIGRAYRLEPRVARSASTAPFRCLTTVQAAVTAQHVVPTRCEAVASERRRCLLQRNPTPMKRAPRGGHAAMQTPPIVSPQEWQAEREKLLVKEKELTRARDALAAERRRMPWMAVEGDYRFEGPDGPASLADLFDGRRQLIVYRAFYAPDVTTYPAGGAYPERACVGC